MDEHEFDLGSMYQQLEEMCMKTCLRGNFKDFNEFFECVQMPGARIMYDFYGPDIDTVFLRLREYLENYSYFDPVTNKSKTFVEWSNYFDSEHYDSDRLVELYEASLVHIKENKGLKIKNATLQSSYYSLKDKYEAQKIELERLNNLQKQDLQAKINPETEMKEEALFRMNKVIEYKQIVDEFRENGIPMVYEPPYGACYALEDDELMVVKDVELSHKVLVWGVIRCFENISNERFTLDNLLYVSRNKKFWKDERKNLFEFHPHVICIDYDSHQFDQGEIQIYKSEGGTLLRR